tara:strand:+ start:250 stop:882 length:633 start_codon:yes stop_codon:yes gene_type:complete
LTWLTATVLLAHTLPPYRPLQNRLKQAEGIAIVEVLSQKPEGLRVRPILILKGNVPTELVQAEGHSLPNSARFGLITVRQQKAGWTVQEQNREWVELSEQSVLTWAKAAHRVRRGVKSLSSGADHALLETVEDPILQRLAGRELMFRLYRRSATQLAQTVLKRLRTGRYRDAQLRDALKAGLMRRVRVKADQAKLERCLAIPTEPCPTLR